MDANNKDQVIEIILQSLRNGCTIKAACEAAQIDPSTFWHWRIENLDLQKQVDEIKQVRVEVVEDALFQSAIGGNVMAQMFWLMNRAGDTWKDKRALVNNTIVSNVSQDPEKAFIKALPDKDLNELINRLNNRMKQADDKPPII